VTDPAQYQKIDEKLQWSSKPTQEMVDAFSKLLDQMRASKPTIKLLVSLVYCRFICN
jgi:hypothetical protein